MLFVFAFADAQDRKQNTSKKKQATEQHEQDSTSENASTENTVTPATEDDPRLLGEDNDKSKRSSDQNPSSDYRNNKVSGNPNNRNVNEGSNRRSEGQNQSESSNAAPAVNPHNSNQTISDPGSPAPVDEVGAATESSQDNTGGTIGENTASQTPANPQTTNAPAVTQETSSQSGSPAVLSEENGSERDGTNNVQRAEPNMVGSPVKGIKTKGSVDENQEIRKGTNQQLDAGTQDAANNSGQNTNNASDQAQQNNVNGREQRQQNAGGIGNESDKKSTVPSRVKKSEAPKETGKNHNAHPGLDHPEGGQADQESNQDANTQTTVPAMDQNPNLITEEDEEDKKQKRKNKKKNKRNKRNRD